MNADPERPAAARLGEAVAVGSASALVGGLATLPLAMPVAGAVAAGCNGVVCGWKGVYDFGAPAGWWAWLRDSTWALPTTTAGMVVLAAQWLRGDRNYLDVASRRQNRIAFGGGWRVRRGFATTIGNVVVNAFDRAPLDPDDPANAARMSLISRHEHRHVQQARRYGVFYPSLYASWMAAGVVRATWWKLTGDPHRWKDLVMTASYFDNPFERAAYRADEYWPPRGAITERLRPIRDR